MAGAWLEVFSSGTHTSGNGVTKTYTDDDLVNLAKTYNEQKDHEAPLVLGHPATDDPAYGWTKKLKAAGSKLLAYVDQVEDAIVSAVNKGSYKKVSIAIYPNGLLRHIGLLGAVPPAVKGLASVKFAEGLEFDEFTETMDGARPTIAAKVFAEIRDFMVEKFGLVIPPAPLPGDDFSELKQQEEKDMKEVDDLKAQVTALEGKLAEQATQFAAQFTEVSTGFKTLSDLVTASIKTATDSTKASAFETAKAAFTAFCESLAKEGKILPAEKDAIIEEYADLLQAEETMTFAEGKEKPSEKMKIRLTARKPIFAPRGFTFADGTKASPAKPDASQVPDKFSELADQIDPASLDIDRQIKEYAEKNKVSYEDAAAAFAQA